MNFLDIARKAITLGPTLTTDEQAAWDALSVGEQTKLKNTARRRDELRMKREVRADLLAHGEPARKHYATLTSDTRRTLGVVRLLQEPRHGKSRPRARGAGRPKARASSARRSSERSGDSGSEGGEPEPSPAGRLCECGCGLPLTGKRRQARYLNEAHRKRAQRQRDRLTPDRVAERRLVLLTEAKAPPPVRCKCDPKGHLVDGVVCVPCGRARGNGGAAWLWLAGDIPSRQLAVHQPSRAREWRTRPNRSESARLRRTRRDYVDESIIKAAA